jgi:hypothetical protein
VGMQVQMNHAQNMVTVTQPKPQKHCKSDWVF